MRQKTCNTQQHLLWFWFRQAAFLALATALLAIASSTLADDKLEAVRLWHSAKHTRIVFDVTENVEHSVFRLQNPDRVVVDIKNGGKFSKLPQVQENIHVSAMRSGAPTPDVLRVVFDLKQDVEIKSFVLTPNELYGHRLVVDLNGRHSTANASEPVPVEPTSPATESLDAELAPATQPAQLPVARPFTVAVDAGHGGEDPGALGHRGSREKHITLEISKRLQKVINKDPRMRAFLVREGDYYIKLNRRRQIARERGADLFISVHADAFPKSSANGLSVFALSQRGATSAMASALAVKENASDSIGGVSLADKDEVLAKVLVDLSMTATISDSVNFGGRVLNELSGVGRLHSKRVEQAGFAVLKSPDMPSILLETGFITNPTEERRLRTASYQNKIAQAVYKAIVEFYEQTPYLNNGRYDSPSLQASSGAVSTPSAVTTIKHKVRRGDTLSELAENYGTSMAAIKRENRLKRNTLWLGETLKITSRKSASLSSQTRQPVTPRVHTVTRGDSLSSISARYNITIRALKRANNLRGNTLYLGQKISLPGTGPIAKEKRTRYHTVKRGDTLSEIAERYGTTVSAIKKINKLRSNTAFLGQKLRIPG